MIDELAGRRMKPKRDWKALQVELDRHRTGRCLGIPDVARIAYEMTRWYGLTVGIDTPIWDNATVMEQKKAFIGVLYHLDHLEETVQENHDTWRKAMEKDGWVYGIKQDGEAKTHPALIPYEELSEQHRAMDAIFTGAVRSLLVHFDGRLPLGMQGQAPAAEA